MMGKDWNFSVPFMSIALVYAAVVCATK